MKVLLVEDDLDLSAALSRVLTRRGMAIDHCTDGVQALVHLGAGQYDVVMLDLGLPVMDGLFLYAREGNRLWQQIGDWGLPQHSCFLRPSNLEDVFLRLTGRGTEP